MKKGTCMNNIKPTIQKAIKKMGYETLTPIQNQIMPLIRNNQDVIGESATGTGKTAAFVIPILEAIDTNNKEVQTLFISPTRELALQLEDATKTIGEFIPNLRTLTVYGGASIGAQLKGLKKHPQIIIATPGRLIDFLNRKALNVKHITHLVLDEADEMLKMGFKEDIEEILKQTNPDRQTLMFSATMPQTIKALANKYMKNPVHIQIETNQKTSENITQYYYKVQNKHKLDAMIRLIERHQLGSALVFCNTKRMVDEVATNLSKFYSVGKIHGDLTQAERTNTIRQFHQRQISFLVGTDVAARGLDIKEIDAVFNYDLPQKYDYYIHRIGRTGRASQTGFSFTLVTPKEENKIKQLEKFIKTPIKKQNIPTPSELEQLQATKLQVALHKTISNNNHQSHKNTAKELLQVFDPADLVAALLEKSEPKMNTQDINLEEKQSKRSNKSGNSSRSSKSRTRFHINIGKSIGLTKKSFANLIKDKTTLNNQNIKDITINSKNAFFSVDEKHERFVYNAMEPFNFYGKKVSIQEAKSL
jgi:ATP-dependent RNA helicase DeaD